MSEPMDLDRWLRVAETFRSRRDFLKLAASAGAMAATGPIVAACGGASSGRPAEKFPVRPVNIIVGYGTGGGSDQLARKVSPIMEQKLGQPFPVVNSPGADGAVGMEKLTDQPADGYNVEVYIADTNAQVAAGAAKWKASDIQGVARLMLVPSFLFVSSKSKWQTIDDLIADAKGQPGKLKVATVGRISVDAVTISYVEQKAGVKFNQVPYSKPSERYASVLSGETDVVYEQGGDVQQFVRSGQYRPLVIFRESRLPAFPNVPSSKEKGWDIFYPQWRGLVVRAGTPKERVDALYNAAKAWSTTDDFKQFTDQQFMDPKSFAGPDEFTKQMRDDTSSLHKQMVDIKMITG